MYKPPLFREERLEVQHGLIRRYPLGLLISSGPDHLWANTIPFLVTDGGLHGTLQAHLAKANPQWQHIDGKEVLVVFQGADAYVTPSWYETKKETGKVVPTWNYAMVQVRGVARVIDDPDWLASQITRLTHQQEAPRAERWAVGDAPADFIASQIKGIIGIEIPIREIEGKWKVSQNRNEADRRGVARGLEADGDKSEMAELVKSYGGV